MALGVVPGDPNSATKAFAILKHELAKGKAAQETAHLKSKHSPGRFQTRRSQSTDSPPSS
jgi:hypothetical protein